jgi:alpha-2-macroglobulin
MRKIFFWAMIFFNFTLYASEFGPSFKKSEDWKKSPAWSKVSKLYNEQKFQAASTEAEKLIKEFEKKADDKNWALGLILKLNLKMSLGEMERAVLEYKKSSWPKSFSSQFLLKLYYSIALREYYQIYSYEVNQREKIVKVDEADLKSWTKDDLYNEIKKTLESMWKEREHLKDRSTGELDLFVSIGSYPESIRGTLRDTFVYFYSDFLADSSFWSPFDLSQVKVFKIESLLNKDENTKINSAHPLRVMAKILHDHSDWQEKRKNAGAALEAKIELARKLRTHYVSQNQLEILKSYLIKISKEEHFIKDSWWSELMYTIGLFYNEENAADSKIKSIEVASQGQKKYPESVGAKRCKHLIATIKAPSLSLIGMRNDLAGKKSLTLSFKNWGKVFFRAYKIDPVKRMLENHKNYGVLPGHQEWRDFLSQNAHVAWSQDLQETKDYKEHQLHLMPPIKEKGFYLIFMSAKESFLESENQISTIYFQQTDLHPLKWYAGGIQRVKVLNALNGESIPEVSIDVYKLDWQKGHNLVKSFKTDKAGEQTFSKESLEGYGFILHYKTTSDSFFDDHQINFYRDNPASQEATSLIFTDRAIYRPKQKIYFKVLSFTRNSQADKMPTSKPQQDIEVTLYDANGEKVSSQKLKTNAFATASGTFDLPLGKVLGNWRIGTNVGHYQQYIKVEEYKRPSMRGEIAGSKEQLSFDKKATFLLSSKYYYGQPLRSGKVSYQIKRRSDFSEFHYHRRSRYMYIRNSEEDIVATGSGILDQKGEFDIEFTPKKPSLELGAERYHYSIEAEVLNEGGETLKLSKSFTLAKVNIMASWQIPRLHFFPDQKIGEQKILRSDLNGQPRSGKGEWKIYQLKSPEKILYPADYEEQKIEGPFAHFYHADDFKKKRWEGLSTEREILALRPLGSISQQGQVSHDDKGIATFTISPLKPGDYRYIYTSKDDAGEEYTLEQDFIVLQGKKNFPLIFVSDKQSVLPGEEVQFFLSSPYKNQKIYYEVHHLGKMIESKTFHAEDMKNIFNFKIKKEHIGGLIFKVYTVADQSFLERTISIQVPHHEQEISFEITRLREVLTPGAEETVSFKIKGKNSKGEKITLKDPVEVLAYMYDQSLDFFGPVYAASLENFFPRTLDYSNVQGSVGHRQAEGFAWNLVSYPNLPALYGSRLELFEAYAIGGPGSRGGMVSGAMLYESDGEGLSAPKGAPAPARNRFESKKEKSVLAKKSNSASDKDTLDSKTDSAAMETAQASAEVRSNFAETAFWLPHLLAKKNQEFEFSFKVPDSLTSWNFWLKAISPDLKYGAETKVLQTMKDFMVRTYLPRFFRQQDEIAFNVQVENHSKTDQEGKLVVSILDEDDRPIHKDFVLSEEYVTGKKLKVAAGQNLSVDIELSVPMRLGLVKVKVLMQTKDFSDGEIKAIPLLPSRIHLVDSKFVALSKDHKSRVMKFDGLLTKDESRVNEKFVVTAEGQLFYSLLKALPYLIDYPYECTEQTLNRYVSTSMIAGSMSKYPKLAASMKTLSKRKTQFESFDELDANRKTLMEETPWLQMSRGGSEEAGLLNMLNPDVVKAEEASSLSKLKKSQLPTGAFPWFPGGPPSFYMTSYILYGFSKAAEFKGTVPEDLIKNAFTYVKDEYRRIKAHCMTHQSCFETITFLNFILSQYKDPKYFSHVFSEAERVEMLDFSFTHWKQHSPQLKSMLAMTLKRFKRDQNAVLVLESILDSAKSDIDLGVYFAPEDRSWLWYNDTVETQAIFLRALTEVIPNHKYRSGLTQWLFLNKKMNHWKSTKATAEAIYSVLYYLSQENMMEQDESITVEMGSIKKVLEFKNAEVEKTKAQLVFRDPDITAENFKEVKVTNKGNSFNFVSANWHYSTQKAPAVGKGDMLSVSRKYFKRTSGDKVTLSEIKSGDTLNVGDQVEVHLSLRAKHAAEYVHLRDPRPAGMEPEKVSSGYHWDLGLIRYEEIKDSATNFFMEQMPVGEYTLKHRLRVNMKGKFLVGPATLQSVYAPEFNAYSSGFEVGAK